MKKYLTIAALALATVAGCTKESSRGANDGIAPSFTSSISTRANGTEWESGDQVGIIVTFDNAMLEEYRYNNLYNVSFTDPEQGELTADSADDKIYYPIDEEQYVDFYAYYPYSASVTAANESYAVSIADQSSPKAIDFMEASTRDSGGYNKYNQSVPLTFSRNMAKISLQLKAGEQVDLSEITAVRLEGFYTSATYALTTNSFGNLAGEDVAITPYIEGENLYSAILIPENATSHIIYFTSSLGDMPLDLSSYTLEKGEHSYFTVTVNRSEASYQVNKIADWNDADIDNNTLETE